MISRQRRRRLTIAALGLLVLGTGLWWSTRPKIDPRLVGTWAQLASHGNGYRFREFHAWGVAFDGYDNGGVQSAVKSYSWCVRGDILELDTRHAVSTADRLEILFYKLVGQYSGIRRCRIVEVTPDRLTLQPLPTPGLVDESLEAETYVPFDTVSRPEVWQFEK